jgi:site-specific DNA-methyltransferase (adenine-specific)
MKLTIDPEFKALIPPLAPEELAQLEANIIRDGCREPLVVWNGLLIDGHNRYAICTRLGIDFRSIVMEFSDRESVMDWMDSNQLGRRNLSPDAFKLALGRRYNRTKKTNEERASEGGKAKSAKGQIDPKQNTAAKLAKEHSVSEATVKRAGKFAEEVAKKPELQKAINEKRPVKMVIKETRKAEKKEELERAVQIIADADHSDSFEVFHLSMQEVFEQGIKADCIISDPPYPREFVGLYGDLAALASKHGISRVAVMCGQTYLPQIMEEMCKHLEYRWTIAYLTPGGQAVQQWQTKVNTFWKPILIFGSPDEWIGDVTTSKVNDNDKRFHEWGQSESGMMDLVSRLSKPGETVFDPFMGAGTTGVVSLALGRKFIGCDIDDANCKTSSARMVKTIESMGQ